MPGFAQIFWCSSIPFTRKIILNRFIKKNKKQNKKNKDFIEGDYEDISEDDDKKI